MSENVFWGYELRLNCRACRIDAVTDPQWIAEFSKALVKAIDMVAFQEPRIVHFGHYPTTGYTLDQLIETSNITAHFCDQNGNAYFNIFSCKPFDIEVAKQVVQEYFHPERIAWDFTTRDAG